MSFLCMLLRLNVVFVSEACAVRFPELACVVGFVVFYRRYGHCNSLLEQYAFQYRCRKR